MFTSLQDIRDKYNIELNNDNVQDYTNEIIEIFNGCINETDDPHLLHVIGLYYDSIKDYDQMTKYYMMAIEKGKQLQ